MVTTITGVMVAGVTPEYLQKENQKTDPVPGEEAAPVQTIGKGDREKVLSKTPLPDEVQKYLSMLNVSLAFEIDNQTGELVTKVINRETKEVIRQIPTDDLLKLHESLAAFQGVLFNGKA
jgi:flagellar protein FlaG